VFGEKPPFKIVESSYELANAMNQALAEWTSDTPKIMQNWWLKHKHRLIMELREDVRRLNDRRV
jgi:hypothetical protein